MSLDVIAVINIMNIVVIHFPHARYQLLLSNINTLKRFYGSCNRSHINIYMHIQFEIFRLIEKFTFTYIHRLYIDRFLMCIRWIENKFVKKRFFVKKWNFFYVTSWRICSKKHNRFQIFDFHFFYSTLNIANFESRFWNSNVYKR